jgi:hypothetical protein
VEVRAWGTFEKFLRMTADRKKELEYPEAIARDPLNHPHDRRMMVKGQGMTSRERTELKTTLNSALPIASASEPDNAFLVPHWAPVNVTRLPRAGSTCPVQIPESMQCQTNPV